MEITRGKAIEILSIDFIETMRSEEFYNIAVSGWVGFSNLNNKELELELHCMAMQQGEGEDTKNYTIL